jgi:DNA-binding MarR family transcriptional regulator
MTKLLLEDLLEHLHRQMGQERHQSDGGPLSESELAYLRALDRLQDAIPTENDDEDGPHMSELASALNVRNASASAMLKKLEAAGLTERVACRYDARAQHILLTPKARNALKLQRTSLARLASRMEDGLSPDERAALAALLNKALLDPAA